MRRFQASVEENREVAPGFRVCSFSWPSDVPDPLPGQFFTVRSAQGTDPLLRRPFAFSGFDRARRIASFLFQVRGKATVLLAGLEAGREADILAPLGNGFPLPQSGSHAVLMAGGVGLGPILFFADSLAEAGIPFTFLLGVRTGSLMPKGIVFPGNTVFCTDDGTMGFKGNPVDAFREILPGDTTSITYYACGPRPLLKGCRDLALETGSSCFVSVEQVMACGVGACMGCAVKKSDETTYFRACADGPVFPQEALSWK